MDSGGFAVSGSWPERQIPPRNTLNHLIHERGSAPLTWACRTSQLAFLQRKSSPNSPSVQSGGSVLNVLNRINVHYFLLKILLKVNVF